MDMSTDQYRGGIACRGYRDYDYQNYFNSESAVALDSVQNISQSFIAKGNVLNSISVYFGEISDQVVNISILDQYGKIVVYEDIKLNDYSAQEWNKIGLNSGKFKRNEQYEIVFSSKKELSALYLDMEDAPTPFAECRSEGKIVEGNLAVGFQFTYTYLTLGSLLEFMIKLLFLLVMTVALCYTIWNFEQIYAMFRCTHKKKGVLYATYFSTSFALFYNPLEQTRNEVSEFKRVIGTGLADNVDVSKRIANFNGWFVLLGVLFILFWMLTNYFLQKERNEEGAKIISFTDNFIVLAVCNLLLLGINYFSDNKTLSNVLFRFSAEVILLIMIILLAYCILGIDRNIDSDALLKLVLIASASSYPVAIFISLELEDGKVVLGVMAIFLIFVLGFCRYAQKIVKTSNFNYIITGGVLVFSLIPVVTSVFIEMVHVLNQYSIFLGHPSRYFMVAMILLTVIGIMTSSFFKRKAWIVKKWKRWSYPWLVFGVTCLSVQIPIQSVFSPDICEGANYGVLISDFFSYGKIPIVEHYGGHMMTGVWEGILYGIVNSDYTGAIVSPYSMFLMPILAVLFFYLVKSIWNEDMALAVSILFPYMGFWSYYGLGMLVCLAAVSYVRKNSYIRAIVLWLAFFWCTVYRLDLGFAFGIAAIVSLIIYVLLERNTTALKELGLTLIGFGVSCGLIWIFLCIIKGINPIDRLMEFLMLSLSNLNWAYGYIGDSNNSVFSWSYIMIPFLTIICILYMIFSKEMRERIGYEKWMLIMILGFSYIANFSRGLVRHSLAEGLGTVIVWSSYIFLAIFFSCLKNNNKLLLPIFMFLMLCNTLFVQDSNFTSVPIVDTAMSKPSPIIESWKAGRFDEEKSDELNYWHELKYTQEVVERVQLSDELVNTVNTYALILNVLLNEDETFVDFTNRTLLYSILGRENPLYVSQSPLQLSGELTQKQYINEISDTPVVLMPLDPYNDHWSSALDNIANIYRNYKVAEYIYQKYVPLCKYENKYAVWCLKEQYYEYKIRVKELIEGIEHLDKLAICDGVARNEDGTCTLRFSESKPAVCELRNVIDFARFDGLDILVRIRYTTDMQGELQMYYTTEKDECYTEEKAVAVEINGSGVADFQIPATEYTQLCLSLPKNGTITVSSLVVKHVCDYIEYGYDGPTNNTDGDGVISFDYVSSLHNYNIGHIPRLWAEADKSKAVDSRVITDLIHVDDFYIFNINDMDEGKNENYLKINAIYDGKDTEGRYRPDDETVTVTVIAGSYESGQFSEKCRFTMTFAEGRHDYLVRISADYYWYLKEINAVRIQEQKVLRDVTMQILEGD